MLDTDIAGLVAQAERQQAEVNHTLGALQYARAIRAGIASPMPESPGV